MIKNFTQILLPSKYVFQINLVSKTNKSYSCLLQRGKSYMSKLEIRQNNLKEKQIPIVLLSNQKVVLTPLAQSDFQRLFKVASDPLIWEQHNDPDRYKREVFHKYFEGAIQSKGAFLISNAVSGSAIGSSRFYDFDPQSSLIKIGYTFFPRDYWGSTYNKEVKSLMLNYAFKFVQKVCFEAWERNFRSQKAIERLGAKKIGQRVLAISGDQIKINFVYELKKQAQKAKLS